MKAWIMAAALLLASSPAFAQTGLDYDFGTSGGGGASQLEVWATTGWTTITQTPTGSKVEAEVSLSPLANFTCTNRPINYPLTNACRAISYEASTYNCTLNRCYATADLHSPGNHWGIWYADAKNYYITPTGTWQLLSTTHRQLNFGLPPPNDPCHYNGGGYNPDCPQTPIVVPTRRSPLVRFTSAARGVPFDLDGDGVLEMVAWPKNGAWLAIDINDDGAITSGQELFGNHTGGLHFANGFEALEKLFVQGVDDGKIDLSDPIYGKLLLWEDLNHDGLSTPDELSPASDLLKEIFLGYTYSDARNASGTHYAYRGFATWQTGETKAIYDVFPDTDEIP